MSVGGGGGSSKGGFEDMYAANQLNKGRENSDPNGPGAAAMRQQQPDWISQMSRPYAPIIPGQQPNDQQPTDPNQRRLQQMYQPQNPNGYGGY